ncbi:MAG: hypothetical protein WCD35_02940 [Mycobacteriales bacterium]
MNASTLLPALLLGALLVTAGSASPASDREHDGGPPITMTVTPTR